MLVFSQTSCVKRIRNESLVTAGKANDQQSSTANPDARSNRPANLININSASADELESLPGVGKALAARIIEHREKYGPFRRAEHLIIVRGISDRKFRALRDLITVE